jgi:AcrR family transcriptional regulator
MIQHSGPEPRPPRGRPRGDGAQYLLRRREVIAAAARLFAQKGYEATSIGDIAEEVGLLKGSLYYYAPSKEDLLYAIIREVEDEGPRLAARYSDPRADAVTLLHDLIADAVRFMVANREQNVISMRDFRALSKERQDELQPDRMAMWAHMRGLIQRGRKEGVIRDEVDATVAATAILGALNYLPVWYQSGKPPSADRMAEGYAALFVEGLRASPEAD